MDDLEGRVAVITGGASGIGLALTRAFLAAGTRVVIADIELQALDDARAALGPEVSERVHSVLVDVADLHSVEVLAASTLDRFGQVDIVCNNAGVSTFNTVDRLTMADWQWVLGVDLWGVINGVHTFLPIMLQQGTPGHIVNTASIAGLVSGIAHLAPYAVAKVGVVSLSETLRMELQMSGAPIGVSVLCPSSTNTNVMEGERNRPQHLGNEERTDDAEAWRVRDPQRLHRPGREGTVGARRHGPRRGHEEPLLGCEPRRPPPRARAALHRDPRRDAVPVLTVVASESGDLAHRGARLEIGERGFGAAEERLGEHAALLAHVFRERHHLTARGHEVRGQEPMLEPRVVERDRAAAARVAHLQVVAEQLALVVPAIVDVEGKAEEVAHVAHRRAHLDEAPVEEAGAAVVVEQVPEMRIAVHDCRRPGSPERLQHLLVVDVELGDRGEVGTQPVSMMVEPVPQERRAVVVLRVRLGHPSGQLPPPRRVLELEVQVGEILERGVPWRRA